MDTEANETDLLNRGEGSTTTRRREPKEGPSAKRRQYVAAFIAHFGAIIMAEIWAFPSTALPSMREGEHALGLSSVEEAWMSSITFLGAAVGSPLCGLIIQKLGIKTSLVVITVPVLLTGWLMITLTQNLTMILVGRFITGAFVAGIGVSTNLIAEIGKKERRGRLNFLFDMSFCVGILLLFLFGVFFNWRIQAGICAAQCAIFIVLLTQIYESPRSLLEKDNEAKAREALAYYRDENVNDEIQDILRQIDNDRDIASENSSSWSFLHFFADPTVMKPIYIALALQFFLQLCGVVTIVGYAVDVFKKAGSKHENLSTCIFGLINLLATFGAYFLIDKVGRRFLLILSEALLAVTLFGLGLFLYFKDTVKVEALQGEFYTWFPLGFLIFYIIAYSLGVGPIPWVVLGEVVNSKAKGFSNGVIMLFTRIFGFLAMFYFNDMMILLGQHGVYWIYAGICIGGFLFSLFLLPETKEKDLNAIQEEIQEKWIHFKCS